MDASSEPGAATQIPAEIASQELLGESRWPPAAALVVFMALRTAVAARRVGRAGAVADSVARGPPGLPARARNPAAVDFAFVQHLSPELAPPTWRPVFLDYLHLGFTNATAFSPTDVMTLRATYVMLVQATVALALFGLVVARAVNAFT